MNEKLKNLWNSNKILFFIILPLTILFIVGIFLRDFVLAWLKGSARDATSEARKTDEELSAKAQAAQSAAIKTKTEADDLQKKIDDRNDEDVPDDWFKNK